MHRAALLLVGSVVAAAAPAAVGQFAQSAAQVRQSGGPYVPISGGNTARQLGASEWEWTVYVMGDSDTLGRISCVTYLLHATFENRTPSVCVRGSLPGKGFPLTAKGWGTFTVGITVEFKDKTQQLLTHALSFRTRAEGWAPVAAGSGSAVTIPVTAANATDGDFAFTLRYSSREGALRIDAVDVAVNEDGSGLATRWSFELLLDDQPWLRLPARSFSDRQAPVRIPGTTLVPATLAGRTPSTGSTIRIMGYR